MKHQKNSLLSQGGLSMNRFGGNDDSANAGSFTFEPEPVMIENLDDKSVLIIDFQDSSAQIKTLLDLEEASLVTKSVEPFFLDAVNGNLYSWEASSMKVSKASSAEESKTSE